MSRNESQHSADLSIDETTALKILNQIDKAPFVGRAPQLALCKQAVDRSTDGCGSAIVIYGESGAGKSRLIREVREYASERGGTFIETTCPAESGAPPYSAWIRALRQLSDPEAARLLERSSDTNRPVPFHKWILDQAEPAEHQFNLFTDVVAALRAATRDAFLVIAIDDLQWADPASLDLLGFITARVVDFPLVIMLALRSEDLPLNPAVQRTLDDLNGARATTSFRLDALSPEDLVNHASSLLGHSSSPLIQNLADSSEGNPLVLEELVRMLVLSNRLHIGASGDELDKPQLPATIRTSIQTRIARLNEIEQTVLQAAAVVGKRFDCSIVSKVAALDSKSLESVLETLTDFAFVVHDVETFEKHEMVMSFMHDRTREVVLDSIKPAELIRWHRAVAKAIEQDAPSRLTPQIVSSLANHYLSAGDNVHAATYLEQLGNLSIERHAAGEGVLALRKARSLLLRTEVDDERIGYLEVELGRALLSLGKAEATEMLTSAGSRFMAGGNDLEAARAIGLHGLALAQFEQHEEATARYRQALELLNDTPESNLDKAWIMLHLSEVIGPSLSQHDQALDLQREAYALLEDQDPDDPLRSAAAVATARTLIHLNRLDEAAELLNEGFIAATASDDFAMAAEIDSVRATVCYWLNDVRQSEMFTHKRQEHAARIANVFSQRHVSSWLAVLALAQGKWQEARSLLDIADQQAGAFDSPEPRAFAAQVRGQLELQHGDPVSGLALMMAANVDFREMGQATRLWYLGSVAYANHVTDNVRMAVMLREESWNLISGLRHPPLSQAATLVFLALIDLENQSKSHLMFLYDKLEPFKGQLHWILVDRVLGMLATDLEEPETAKGHFSDAMARAASNGLLPELARTRCELALHFPETERESQKVQLSQAFEALEDVELSFELARFKTLHQDELSNIFNQSVAGLTEREIEVLKLIAMGKTNREIGDTLFITEKTVINHVTHIFDKADLDNRAAAAAFAVRHGLTS